MYRSLSKVDGEVDGHEKALKRLVSVPAMSPATARGYAAPPRKAFLVNTESNPKGVDHMQTRGRLTMLITICVWTFLCPWAYGQSGEASAPSLLSSPWKFGLAPYLWVPAMQGEITVRGHTVDVDLDLEDTLDLVFDSLKFAFMGRAEAHKGPLLFTLDLLYLDLEGDQTTTRGLRAELTTQLLITEFGAGYRLGTFALGPVVYPYLALDFLAGGRYVFLETGLDITGGRFGRAADIERDVDWIEPFVGGRVTLRFSNRAAVIVRGDAGGFGVGSDLTWSLVGTFQYYLSRAVSLDIGYRVLDIDYDQGSGANLFRFDVRMHGPLFGAVFRF